MLRKMFLVLALGGLVVSARAEEAKIETTLQKFSYGMGIQIAGQMRQAGVPDLDAAAFSRGITDVLNQKKIAVDVEEIKAAFQEMAEKRKVAQASQNEERSKLGAENKAEGDAFMAQNKDAEGITTLDSGIQYKVNKEATGATPAADDTVVVHYRGRLLDGTEFDSSYSRNQPTEFRLNAVIKGWQEVVGMMSPGANWTVWIPSELAYGERGAGGSIGPNETLNFDIELVEIKGK